MKSQSKDILNIIKYLTLIPAIGFSIECGSQIFSLVISFLYPSIAQNTYKVIKEIYELYGEHQKYFYITMSFSIMISGLKAFIWYYLFDFLLKLNLDSPFNHKFSVKIQNLGYFTFGLWLVAVLANSYMKYIFKKTSVDLIHIFDNEMYLFMAGIVYIISQIFRRGVELQEENELTV
ncbi:hypothetical protein Emtol_3298 [Emticicia oligotrophica DSM 17448]|uniref:DUF2975 domain-containing protein n=1 Tax=Emticicia oligotrophica (strain DSM 17448 / CIP 109782 / MTCC 6937 / GPTSA100-15) TaxID=929562 RepID=A0ABN4AQ10_EMTOG|nr:DUF2975 domain-containing protein [Emticicia oligotrophica]AFK04427.1 hypothetical protein Emtol_3298 [Emticicia oligotrophica DSM 17448]